jgi:CubicO group peptidase (beta-lactamase class C family)
MPHRPTGTSRSANHERCDKSNHGFRTGRRTVSDRLQDVLPAMAEEIAEGISQGWHRGVAVSISQGGSVVVDGAIGTSHDGVPLTADTLLPWLSAGKPLTAVRVLQLLEAGQLTLQTAVADIIPEFAATSLEVRVEHLLTHTAGLAAVDTGWPEARWDEIIDLTCAAGLQEGWVPGERAAYDSQRGWFVLGEIVRRLTAQSIDAALRENLLLPLEMNDTWLAMPADVHRDYGDRIGRTYEIRGPRQELTDLHLPRNCAMASPGSGAWGPIGDLRKFYEMLIAGGAAADGEPVLQPPSVELMTRRHREGMFDETFGHTLDFGLGVIINSNRYGVETVPYGYGVQASEGTFGHGGARSCIAFADPPRQLAVAILANGYLSEPRHQQRMRRLLAAMYDDLHIRADPAAPDTTQGTH